MEVVPRIPVEAEKFMDLAFLNSLSRYSAIPPADPWLSGSTINYYYWGYLLAAAQAKLSGVPPLTAYNLAIATFAGRSFAHFTIPEVESTALARLATSGRHSGWTRISSSGSASRIRAISCGVICWCT